MVSVRKPRRKAGGGATKAPPIDLPSLVHLLETHLKWISRYCAITAHNTYLCAQANRPDRDGNRPVWTPRHSKGDAQITLPLSSPPTTPTDIYEYAAADERELDGIDRYYV